MVSPTPPTNAQSLFEIEKLPFPPMPVPLVTLLRQEGAAVFSTKMLNTSPYEFGHYLKEFESDSAIAPYALVGFAGHGINSWAVHFYIVHEGLALFIQLPWGGAYLEPEPARAKIADLFEWSALLQSKLSLARQMSGIPKAQWLQVAASHFSFAGWRWLEAGADRASVPWQEATGMKATLLQILDQKTRKSSALKLGRDSVDTEGLLGKSPMKR